MNRKRTHLEPNLEVESSTGVTSGMQEAEGDAAVDAAAEQNCDLEALIGQRAREIRLKIGIEQVAGRSGDGGGAASRGGGGGNGGGGDGWSKVWEEAEREGFGREEGDTESEIRVSERE